MITIADTIKIPKADLEALIDLYDGIGHADRSYKSCQSSAFRKCVSEKMQAAAKAFADLAKPPKKGMELLESDTLKLAAFGKALEDAAAAYPADAGGNLNYRAYVHGVHQAPVNVRLMDMIRNIISG